MNITRTMMTIAVTVVTLAGAACTQDARPTDQVGNLVQNPSFESGLNGWRPGDNAEAAATSDHASAGTRSAKITARTDGVMYFRVRDYFTISVRSGEVYSMRAFSRALDRPRPVRGLIRFYNDDGEVLHPPVFGDFTEERPEEFTRFEMVVRAPKKARFATVHVHWIDVEEGEVHYLDMVDFRHGTVPDDATP